MKQTFNVTKVRPKMDGAYLGYGPNFDVEVEFPDNYNHLEDAHLDPIGDAVVAYLNREGWDCNGADYQASAADMSEERITLKMGG